MPRIKGAGWTVHDLTRELMRDRLGLTRVATSTCCDHSGSIASSSAPTSTSCPAPSKVKIRAVRRRAPRASCAAGTRRGCGRRPGPTFVMTSASGMARMVPSWGDAGELWTVNLGVVEYREAWALQERVRAARQADAIPDTLLLLERCPSTRAAGARPRASSRWASEVPDAGHRHRRRRPWRPLTYTAQGQLVGYPIMRVADLMTDLLTMEEAIVTALGDEGVSGARGARATGATSSACGPPSARSPRSACTARAR